MLTIRNPWEARARTVIAGEDLEVAQIVKLVEGDALGEPPKVVLVDAADLEDDSLFIGLVDYIPDDDEAVDFVVDPVNWQLTRNTDPDNTFEVPAGEACVIWHFRPVVGLHQTAVDPDFDISTVREPQDIFVSADTGKLTNDDGGATPNKWMGTVYQHEGAEITVDLRAI